ncbi:adaptor protein MecA [Lacticaseibacillus jixianensis]|uniref:Adapter protein MecA n=1 Tax=Lacticaseibacillus jixianensis TaxID=2486012 RepID=A0ABW4B9V0_9LACO|nr:adaptor protein MecA [Lacticaseibacillus jixianensis]
MEMERLNANTIRVLLGNEDLAERGITVLDLLGNHKQIETFFYSILDEVDKDHSFASEGGVTFQVMPSQSGLELLISRNQDQDEDDEPAAADDANGIPDFIRQQLNALDEPEKADEASDEGGFIDGGQAEKTEVVVKLASFEDFVALAQELRLEGATSDLYAYRDTYYLVLTFYANKASSSEIADQTALALEYGTRENLSADVLAEYGKLLMPTSALETGRYYFKK